MRQTGKQTLLDLGSPACSTGKSAFDQQLGRYGIHPHVDADDEEDDPEEEEEYRAVFSAGRTSHRQASLRRFGLADGGAHMSHAAESSVMSAKIGKRYCQLPSVPAANAAMKGPQNDETAFDDLPAVSELVSASP